MKSKQGDQRTGTGDLSIAVDDDLVAAAVESVERHERERHEREALASAPSEVNAEPDQADSSLTLRPNKPGAGYLGSLEGEHPQAAGGSRLPVGRIRPAHEAEDHGEAIRSDAPVALASVPGVGADGLDFSLLAAEWERMERQLAALTAERDELSRIARFGDEERRRLTGNISRTVERNRTLERELKNAAAGLQAMETQFVNAREQVAELERSVAGLQDRRRREIEEQRLWGHASLLQDLLPVVDNLARAGSYGEADPARILEGVRMIYTHFLQVVGRVGVEPVDARRGRTFQPAVHEALAHIPVADAAPGKILDEVVSGFLLNGRLLRAAQVTVTAPNPLEAAAAMPPVEATPEVVISDPAQLEKTTTDVDAVTALPPDVGPEQPSDDVEARSPLWPPKDSQDESVGDFVSWSTEIRVADEGSLAASEPGDLGFDPFETSLSIPGDLGFDSHTMDVDPLPAKVKPRRPLRPAKEPPPQEPENSSSSGGDEGPG